MDNWNVSVYIYGCLSELWAVRVVLPICLIDNLTLGGLSTVPIVSMQILVLEVVDQPPQHFGQKRVVVLELAGLHVVDQANQIRLPLGPRLVLEVIALHICRPQQVGAGIDMPNCLNTHNLRLSGA